MEKAARKVGRQPERAGNALVRQQYLVPRRSVNKLRQLSKQEKVSATEIVRRAIDAYDPALDGELTAQEEGAVMGLLEDIHARMRAVVERIDADSAEWRKRMTALQDGSLREKVRLETEEFFRKHPDALQGIEQLFGSSRSTHEHLERDPKLR